MSTSREYPESYKLFDELGAPQPTVSPRKSPEYPTSYEMFDKLAQPAQKQQPSSQIAEELPSQELPRLESSPRMEKSSFWEKLGKAGAYQAQTSNAVTPEGAGMIVRQGPAGALEGLTLGAVDVLPPKNEEEGFIREIFRMYGVQGPISLANKAIAPLVTLARSSPIFPRTLAALTRLTGIGATGAGIKTAEELFKSGELPTKEEVLKEGAIWAGIDAIMQGLDMSHQFGRAVSNIAKKEGISRKEVFSKLWDSTKNFLKKKISSPKDLKIGDVEVLAEAATKAEAEGLQTAKKPTVKPKTEVETTGLEKLGEMGKGITDSLYEGVFDSLKAGKDTLAGVKDPLIAKAKPYFEQGLINSPEDLKTLVNKGAQALKPSGIVPKVGKAEITDIDALPEAQQEQYADLIIAATKAKLPQQRGAILKKLS